MEINFYSEFYKQIDYILYLFYGYKTGSKFLSYEEYTFALKSYMDFQFANGFLTTESYIRFKIVIERIEKWLIKMEADIKEFESVQIAANALLML